MHRATPLKAASLLLLLGWGHGLRDVGVDVPEAVGVGQRATLGCHYDLEGDALYTVKWYKGGREFYRYTPKDVPPVKIFPMRGIALADIEEDKSNSTQVILREVRRSMTGQYSCEVSADAPSFHTALVSAVMRVVEVGGGRPHIYGVKSHYRWGELLTANCTSPPASPALNITWSINGKSVHKRHVRQYRVVNGDDLEVSMSILGLELARSHFKGGKFKLKCIASLYNVYWQTGERTSQLGRRRGAAGAARNEADYEENRRLYDQDDTSDYQWNRPQRNRPDFDQY